MRQHTALNESKLCCTLLTRTYGLIIFTRTHTGQVADSPLKEWINNSHLCVHRVRLEHGCRHQSEQTEGRNIQDYLRVVKQSKPPTIRCRTHKFAAVTESLKTQSQHQSKAVWQNQLNGKAPWRKTTFQGIIGEVVKRPSWRYGTCLLINKRCIW